MPTAGCLFVLLYLSTSNRYNFFLYNASDYICSLTHQLILAVVVYTYHLSSAPILHYQTQEILFSFQPLPIYMKGGQYASWLHNIRFFLYFTHLVTPASYLLTTVYIYPYQLLQMVRIFQLIYSP